MNKIDDVVPLNVRKQAGFSAAPGGTPRAVQLMVSKPCCGLSLGRLTRHPAHYSNRKTDLCGPTTRITLADDGHHLLFHREGVIHDFPVSIPHSSSTSVPVGVEVSVLFSGRRAENNTQSAVRERTLLPKLKSGMERPSAMKYDAPIAARKAKIIRTDDDGTKYYE